MRYCYALLPSSAFYSVVILGVWCLGPAVVYKISRLCQNIEKTDLHVNIRTARVSQTFLKRVLTQSCGKAKAFCF